MCVCVCVCVCVKEMSISSCFKLIISPTVLVYDNTACFELTAPFIATEAVSSFDTLLAVASANRFFVVVFCL